MLSCCNCFTVAYKLGVPRTWISQKGMAVGAGEGVEDGANTMGGASVAGDWCGDYGHCGGRGTRGHYALPAPTTMLSERILPASATPTAPSTAAFPPAPTGPTDPPSQPRPLQPPRTPPPPGQPRHTSARPGRPTHPAPIGPPNRHPLPQPAPTTPPSNPRHTNPSYPDGPIGPACPSRPTRPTCPGRLYRHRCLPRPPHSRRPSPLWVGGAAGAGGANGMASVR